MNESIEPRTLDQLEAVIEAANDAATKVEPLLIEMAEAAREIRDRELYKSTHESFAAYCTERWGWNPRKSFRMLAWARELPPAPKPPRLTRVTRETPSPRPMSQRAAAKARKERAIETTATESIVRVESPEGVMSAPIVGEVVRCIIIEYSAQDLARIDAAANRRGVSVVEYARKAIGKQVAADTLTRTSTRSGDVVSNLKR